MSFTDILPVFDRINFLLRGFILILIKRLHASLQFKVNKVLALIVI